MLFKNLLTAILVITGFTACNDNTKSEGAASPASTVKSREDSLYTQTIHIHDEVMPEMGKLIGYQKKVQQQIDSIRAMLASTDFPQSVAQRISFELDSLDKLQIKLKMADSAMNAWMDQFDPDPKLPTTEAKADYFEGQKRSAEVMKKTFFEALGEAERRFKMK